MTKRKQKSLEERVDAFMRKANLKGAPIRRAALRLVRDAMFDGVLGSLQAVGESMREANEERRKAKASSS